MATDVPTDPEEYALYKMYGPRWREYSGRAFQRDRGSYDSSQMNFYNSMPYLEQINQNIEMLNQQSQMVMSQNPYAVHDPFGTDDWNRQLAALQAQLEDQFQKMAEAQRVASQNYEVWSNTGYNPAPDFQEPQFEMPPGSVPRPVVPGADVSNWGAKIYSPPDTLFSTDWTDSDKDGIDDRDQMGPGGKKMQPGELLGEGSPGGTGPRYDYERMVPVEGMPGWNRWGGASTSAIVNYINTKTGERFTAPSGGFRPPEGEGWVIEEKKSEPLPPNWKDNRPSMPDSPGGGTKMSGNAAAQAAVTAAAYTAMKDNQAEFRATGASSAPAPSLSAPAATPAPKAPPLDAGLSTGQRQPVKAAPSVAPVTRPTMSDQFISRYERDVQDGKVKSPVVSSAKTVSQTVSKSKKM